MTVTFDLQYQAATAIRGIRFADWVGKFFKFNPLRLYKTWFKKELDGMILQTEGFHKHVVELTVSEAEELIKPTRKITQYFELYNQLLVKSEYLFDPQLKEKYKYLLKALHRLEALLHVQATKDIPVEKMPDHILEGIAVFS